MRCSDVHGRLFSDRFTLWPYLRLIGMPTEFDPILWLSLGDDSAAHHGCPNLPANEIPAVIIVFFIEWLIETQVISPLVMGSKLELHPITIVVVLLTAGNLFGLVGVILGVPDCRVEDRGRRFSWYQQVSGLYEAEHATDDTKQKRSSS